MPTPISGTVVDGSITEGRRSARPSMDGRAEFSAVKSAPIGGKPSLAPARPGGGAQARQGSKSGTTGIPGKVDGAIERNL